MKTLMRVALAGLAALVLSGCVRVSVDNEMYADGTASGEVTFGFSDAFMALAEQDPDTFMAEFRSSPEWAQMIAEYDRTGTEVTLTDYRADGYTGFTVTLSRTSVDDLNLLNAQSGGGVATLTLDGDYLVYHQEGLGSSLTDTGDPQIDAILSDPSAFDSFELTSTISFPGDVVSSSIGSIDGRTVTYTLEDALEGQDIDIRAWAEPHSGGGLPTIAIVMMVLGAALVVGAVVKSTSNRRRESEPLDPIIPPAPIVPEG